MALLLMPEWNASDCRTLTTRVRDPSGGWWNGIKQHRRDTQISSGECADVLHHRFPCAGYWLNLLPTHPFIHGTQPDASGAGGVHPLPCLPLDSPGQMGYSVQPYRFPAQMVGLLGNCDEPRVHYSSLQPMSSVVASPRQLDNAEGNLRITVSVPLNTSFVGGTVSHVQLRFAVDTSFEDFFSCICAKMDLDPKEAQLGYKYHTDRVHDPPHQLSNAQQLAEAFEHGHHLLKHTQVWEVVLEIHNLASAAVGSENDNNQELATSMSFAAEFCKLKEHLKCAKHVGKYCYIQPTDGDHMEQDVYKLTSWAKGIFTGNATYDHPPESNLFDHTPSKQRRLSSTAAQNAPVIHVHL
ncbi:hypothetical protein BKA82DRAFT_4459451, partial [Pisolithus tinctorius]